MRVMILRSNFGASVSVFVTFGFWGRATALDRKERKKAEKR